MFLLQTGDGNLPYIKKAYVLERNAHKEAIKFMRENPQAGELYLSDGLYETKSIFVRQQDHGDIVEEILDEDGLLAEERAI